MKHTPEPWDRQNKGTPWGSSARHEIVKGPATDPMHKNYPTIAKMRDTSEESYDNAKRIVACVNACVDLPTEMLEQGVMAELLQACKEMAQYFYSTMNPGQMPTMAKQAFDTFTRIEAAKARSGDATIL